MNKKHLIAIGIVTVVASFFYAGVWTCESNSLSQCFMLTGLIALCHAIASMLACAIADF